ncbi:hypothetical protein E5161_13105 [Cohnella pontilimi]|uniref:histidine kinase n=1 Tax=Cohnella pontilimi TaxID=2564100 RepID=A0A4U0F9B7_9BACL|nr:ATP-binding protein [Cohnella pontilimi]TJY41353.1 hypothetical protein E5161_13105 [Cohnella pontilimi]
MAALKTGAKVAGTAFALFGLNGLINYYLMRPLGGASEELNRLRQHLDDAVFVLLFAFLAVVLWAMFAVLPRERGYLYLGFISFLTSLQLFWDWNDKKLLFGKFQGSPYGSLAIKCGIVYLAFTLVAHLLNTTSRPVTRTLLQAGGLLWATITAALLLSAGTVWLAVLNRLFLGYVFANMALSVGQFITLLRREQQRAELRSIAAGFFLFAIVLLPDPAKDLMEEIAGHRLGYRMVYWEQCLEDTFAWALLALLFVFGRMFFRRFVQTLKDNQAGSEQIRTQNAALQQEVETRQRLDQLLSKMLRAYRAADWEKGVIEEGRQYFTPHRFVLVKFNETTGSIGYEGDDARLFEEELQRLMHTERRPAGEATATSSLVLGSAGGAGETRLYVGVMSANGGPISFGERDRFALSLMSKYVSIFYEYFQLLESRLKEMEQREASRTPWLSKLFLQMAEKERKRLASDLHDEVLQELLHIRRMLDRTQAEQWDEYKEGIRLGLDNAEFMIRETCRELMPSFLSGQNVLHAVSKLVERTRLRADFLLEFHPLPLSANLSDEQSTAVYRVVQELINNAMKHSEARRVVLEIGQLEGDLQIRYADDGKGMETGTDFASENRFGLRGIAERIHMVGGEVSVTSEPGQGVNIRCTLPV